MAHFGKILKSLREGRGLSQVELAKLAKVSDQRVSDWEQAEAPRIRGANYQRLADALGMKREELDAKWQEPNPLDLNVEPYSEVEVLDVPTFDMAIAAGPWTELPDMQPWEQTAMLRSRRFRVQIRGDSMEKTWPNGSVVEFHCMTFDCGDGKESRLEVGKSYYVQTAESATFKKLVEVKDDELVFEAINRRKYPNKIRVPRGNVSQMAIAKYILVAPEGT